MDTYEKYYTPLELAHKLVDQIHIHDHSRIIDICCGSGNLLKAAFAQNGTCHCYGVDLVKHSIENCTTYVSDGREYALKHSETYDLALANPPFANNKDDKYTDKLFVKEYSEVQLKRIEIEMLLANLRIVKNGGKLLIILPVTFVIGELYSKIRKALLIGNTIEQIVFLPLNAFSPERINCCALVIKKETNYSNTATQVYDMDENFGIHWRKRISYHCMSRGEWTEPSQKNDDLFSIKRGNICSSDFSEEGECVLHNSKTASPWTPSVRHVRRSSDVLKKCIQAYDGDIIIARVGKSAGVKCIYHGKSAYVSDQLLVVTCSDERIANNIMKMDLTDAVKGLSVKYITMDDIYSLYSHVYGNNKAHEQNR